MTAPDLPAEMREALADELGRRRDPRDHAPACADGAPCSYCIDLADALAPLVAGWLAEARAEALRPLLEAYPTGCDGLGCSGWDDLLPETGGGER